MLSKGTLAAALQFRRERDWEKFHTPLNLAIAISVESGELLEQFQWMLPGEHRPSVEQQTAIEHEMADIVILLSYLASDLGVDLDKAVQGKLTLNATRYPVESARGSAKKYDHL